MKCFRCGYENPDNSLYCISCGGSLGVPRADGRQQEPYNYSYHSPPPEVASAESNAVASLIMGIISIVSSSVLVGLVLGPIAMAKGRKARYVLDDRNNNFYIALGGIITGTIGLIISIVAAIVWTVVIVIICIGAGAAISMG